MSGASHLQLQEDIGTVKAKGQQAKQDHRAAEATGDEKAVAFQRTQLEQLQKKQEQLGEKELNISRAQTAGQLCSLLSLSILEQKKLFRHCSDHG